MKLRWKFLVLGLLIVAIAVTGIVMSAWKRETYVIATGVDGGAYSALGGSLVEISQRDDVNVRLKARSTQGSAENFRLIEHGEVDFALVQHGGEIRNGVRTVAAVYREIAHILVRRDSAQAGITGFAGNRVGVGLRDSGTRDVAMQLLSHYGLKGEAITMVEASPEASLKMLIAGDLDGMVLVTAIHAPIIRKAMATGKVKHLSLGDPNEIGGPVDGICASLPQLQPAVIPRDAYGTNGLGATTSPEKVVSVVAVPSLLVAGEHVNDTAVYALTKSIYANRFLLARELAETAKLREPENLDAFAYPVHDGAKRYYRRKDPGFLVIYAEVIALLMSALIAVAGLIGGVRQWMKGRKKQRIDWFYRQATQSLRGMESGTITDLEKEREKLISLRQHAFDQLIDERLTADESFRIFQDLLEKCMAKVEELAKP